MIADRLLFLAVFSLFFTGCAAKPLARAVGQVQPLGCALTRFPTDTRIASTSIDTFVGVYRRGAAALTVRRQDYRLLVEIPGSAVRETRMIGEWRFEDGCGAVYQFSMPINGVGSLLSITGVNGVASSWRTDSAYPVRPA